MCTTVNELITVHVCSIDLMNTEIVIKTGSSGYTYHLGKIKPGSSIVEYLYIAAAASD